MTEASVTTFLEQVRSGDASSAARKIVKRLMELGVADTHELANAAGCSVNTAGARMKTIQSMGLAHKVGSVTKEVSGKKRVFSRYLFIRKKEDRPRYAKAYLLGLAKDKARTIINSQEHFSIEMVARAKAEIDELDEKIKGLISSPVSN